MTIPYRFQFGFPVFDADNHLYETEDALTRHLPQAHKNLFRYIEIEGRKKLLVRGQLTEYIPNPTFDVVARPGSFMAYFAADNPEGKSLRELAGKPMRSIPAFREPAARLELLDQQGIASCTLYPTLASLIEERLIDDPYLTQVAIHAFNEWLYEQWTYNYQDRIFVTPVVNPCVVDGGVAELERVIDRGARVVLLRPAPVSGLRGTRSPFLPEFDPFWARVQESGVLVALHASDSGIQNYINTWEGGTGEWQAFKQMTFENIVDPLSRTIGDTLASAVGHGMLSRFPGVRLVSVENGSGWLPDLLKRLEKAYKKMPTGFSEHPVETFKRQVWVHPFWEESFTTIVDLLGPEHVVFGSDFPHPEGLEDPLMWVRELQDLGPQAVERIASANMYELLGVPRPTVAAAS